MIIKQLSVFLENKIGRLTEITRLLSERNINISAFSIADTSDYGILRMVVSQPELAEKVLKENEITVKVTDVAGLIVPHKPGGLYKALEILSENNITIDYMYAFALNGSATVILRTESLQKTIEVLQAHKLELLKQSDVYQL